MKIAPFCTIAFLACYVPCATGQVIAYDPAATAGESYARGMSGIIDAQGNKNVSDSQARINNQDAYSAAIDNSVKSVNAYWEKKDIYSQHQQQVNEEIQQKRARYIARRGSLDFTGNEFDRTTGKVNWPKILDQSAYDPYRTKLDELFHDRSYNGALTGDQYMEATTALNDWRAAILKQKDEYPSSVLQQMLRFVNKAKRELDDNLS